MKDLIRKYILGFTLIVVFALLATQVRWIVYSIKFQEKVFQKSVTLALNQTITNLTENKGICMLLKQCVSCDSVKLDVQLTSAGVWDKIHNSIDVELKSYDIELDYDLFIVETGSDTLLSIQKEIDRGKYYSQCLHDLIGQPGYKLVVQFPSRTKFFLGQTGLMFLSSVLFIFLLIVSIVYLLRLYKKELRMAEHTKELLNNVSHEFKTPLSSIALASNLIRKRRFSNQEKLINYADLISKENKKLQHLVENLLHLAAIERNEFDYAKEKLDIHEIIKEGVSTVGMILLEKKGKIELKFNAADCEVFADKMHLANVVVNLLSNAIKYSKEWPEIEVSTRNANDGIELEVKDYGIGIPLKYQKYIFDRYYRVPTGDLHNTKGFGIGLAYVKKVVEAHSGKVQVESEPNKATVFRIWLPLFKPLL